MILAVSTPKVSLRLLKCCFTERKKPDQNWFTGSVLRSDPLDRKSLTSTLDLDAFDIAKHDPKVSD